MGGSSQAPLELALSSKAPPFFFSTFSLVHPLVYTLYYLLTTDVVIEHEA